MVQSRCLRRYPHNGYYMWYYRVQPPIDAGVIRSLRNWPIQTMGADILRVAVIFVGSIGREVLATAHDAMLIHAREAEIHKAVAEVVYCMRLASEILTGGFVLNVDFDIKLRDERFLEDRGKRTFAAVEQFVTQRRTNVTGTVNLVDPEALAPRDRGE